MLAEVFDAFGVIVCEHYKCILARRYGFFQHGVFHAVGAVNKRCIGVALGGEPEISPVDAHIVSAAPEGLLLGVAHFYGFASAEATVSPAHRAFAAQVEAKLIGSRYLYFGG